MKYNALDISKFIVNYSNEKQLPVSNLKLQKLLYFVFKEYYKKAKEKLFNESFCAWKLGPVVPEVYYEFCAYGGIPIMREYKIDIDDYDREIITKIVDSYIRYSPYELVNMTHQEGTTWYKVFNHGLGDKEEIPFKLIVDACMEWFYEFK